MMSLSSTRPCSATDEINNHGILGKSALMASLSSASSISDLVIASKRSFSNNSGLYCCNSFKRTLYSLLMSSDLIGTDGFFKFSIQHIRFGDRQQAFFQQQFGIVLL